MLKRGEGCSLLLGEPLVLGRYAVPELSTREFAAPHREQNVALAVIHKGRKRVDRAL